MKKILYIIFTGVTLFSLGSCNDFLNVESPSAFTDDYICSSTDDARKMLLGAYSPFTEDAFTSRMSNIWALNTDVEANECKTNVSATKTDLSTLQRGRMESFKDNGICWDNNYLAIDRANQCIEGITASPIVNDKDMQQMLGECYALRAYRYLMLTQIWGDVPYYKQAAKAGMELDIPRTDKNYIYSASIQDLVNCEGNMYFADQFSAGIERINREFALGLIARIALFRAGYSMNHDGTMKRADDYLDVANDSRLAVTYMYNDVSKTARTSADYYQLAKDYCEKLMTLKDRELNPSFSQIFLNECQFTAPKNDDVLFEIALGNSNSGGDVGWCIGIGVNSSSKGNTTIGLSLSPGYYFTFDGKDIRRDATVSKIYYSNETTQAPLKVTTLTVGKWCRLWLPTSTATSPTSTKGTGINWPIMRYSDVLLMYAEAENHLNGPTASAQQALRRVRNRAFASADRSIKVDQYIDSVSANKDLFFKSIVNERAWEFGGECLRKYDLIRWNLYGAKIDESIIMLRNIAKAANKVELENPEVSKYQNYADVLYYKIENGVVKFLNDGLTKVDPTVTPVAGYSKIDWGKSSTIYSASVGDGYYLLYTWLGYTYNQADPTNVVPYLMPVSTTKTGISNYLKNDGYRFSQYFNK